MPILSGNTYSENVVGAKFLFGTGRGAMQPLTHSYGFGSSQGVFSNSTLSLSSGGTSTKHGHGMDIGMGHIVLGSPNYSGGNSNGGQIDCFQVRKKSEGVVPDDGQAYLWVDHKWSRNYASSGFSAGTTGYFGWDVKIHGGDIFVLAPQDGSFYGSVTRVDLDGNQVDWWQLSTSGGLGQAMGGVQNNTNNGAGGGRMAAWSDYLAIGVPQYGFASGPAKGGFYIYEKDGTLYKTITHPEPSVLVSSSTDEYFGSHVIYSDRHLYVSSRYAIYKFTASGTYTGTKFVPVGNYVSDVSVADGIVFVWSNVNISGTSTNYLDLWDIFGNKTADATINSTYDFEGVCVGGGKIFLAHQHYTKASTGGRFYDPGILQWHYGTNSLDVSHDDDGNIETAAFSRITFDSPTLGGGTLRIKDGIFVCSGDGYDAQAFNAPYTYTEEDLMNESRVGIV